jgi:transcriptional regulator with XRE-family HTH domain
MVQIPRLREWREFRALTQVELAERAGVSSRSVAGYEAGMGARLPTVRKLAEALGVEASDLYGQPDSPLAEAPPSSIQPPLNGFEEERHAGVISWAAYTRQMASRVRGHADDPDSPAFRDPWSALFFVEEANRNATYLNRFVDEQLTAALEIADLEAMHELMAAFEELDKAIETASARAHLMEAGRSHSEIGEARRRAEEAATERESAAAELSGHLGHSA